MLQALPQQWNLLYWLTSCDYKLRDQGTALGFLWTLLNPIIIFAVLYLVFGSWFSSHIEHYSVYLLIGIVHWNFFSLATANAVDLFERRRILLKCFPVTLQLVATSNVLSIFSSYLIECSLVLLIVSVLHGVTLIGILLFILMAVVNLFFALGVAYLLSNFHIFYRDVKHVWSILLRIGFFLTPVFYPLTVIGENKLLLLKLNPLFHTFSYSREALLHGKVQWNWFSLYVLIIICGLFFISQSLIRRNQGKLVERL